MEVPPANKGKAWSSEDEDTLLTLVQEGKSHTELAHHFQRTTAGVSARINQLAYEMVEAGAPHAKVCASTGLTERMLKDVISRREYVSANKGVKKTPAAKPVPAAVPEPAVVPSLAATAIAHSLAQTQREILEVLKETRDLLKIFVNSIEVKQD